MHAVVKKNTAITAGLRYHSWRVPSADKDEWLFLAAVSSFASSTRGIVSPSAEELCGTLGTENWETAKRKHDSKRGREKDGTKRRESLMGRAVWMVSASTVKNRVLLPNNNLYSHIMYIYPPGCQFATVNSAVEILCHISQCNKTKGRQRRRVGWLRKWGSSSNEGNTTKNSTNEM